MAGKIQNPHRFILTGNLLIIGGIFASGLSRQKAKDFPRESIVKENKTITVDLSGAVKNPGVYKLKDGAIVEDAIKAGGGFSDLANRQYISKALNLAQKLSDGSKIYVPAEGEIAGISRDGGVSQAAVQSKVNINSATQAQLEVLPAVGPVTASRIISDRPYQKAEELLSKKVVNKAVFEKIKDLITVY